MAPEIAIISIFTHDEASKGSLNAIRPAARNNKKSKSPDSMPHKSPRFFEIFAVTKPAANEHSTDTAITKAGIKSCGICSEETNSSEKTASRTAHSAAPDTEPMTTARKIINEDPLTAVLLMVTAPP